MESLIDLMSQEYLFVGKVIEYLDREGGFIKKCDAYKYNQRNYVRTLDRDVQNRISMETLQQNCYVEFCRLKIYPRKSRNIFHSIVGSMLLHRGEV